MTNPTNKKRMLAWLLAAVVIGGSISPPAYGHSHVGGDVGHNHRSQQALPPAESHQHHLHSHPDRHATRLGDASEAPAAHAHVAVLWFELTFPASRRDESDPSESERGDLLAFIRVVDRLLPNADDGTNTSSYWVNTPLVRSMATVSLNRSLRHEQPTTADVLLCDTARLDLT